MRSKLNITAEGAEFVKKVEAKEYQDAKTLLLAAYAQENPERVAKIETAKTPPEMQKMFVELTAANAPDSKNNRLHMKSSV